jgi:Tol biopolymer transport system component
LSLQQIGTGDKRVLYNRSDLGLISWYPDGAHLLAVGDNSLWRVSAFDGKKQRFLANKNIYKAALSPDGKWIVFVDNAPGKVWIMGSNGESPIELASLSEAGVFALAWSPTSQRILYRSWSIDKGAIASCDRQGGHEIEIVSNPNLGTFFSMNDVYWGPDGGVFYTLRESANKPFDANIWTVPVDPETGQVKGEPSRVTSYTGLSEGEFSESKSGKELLFYKVSRKDAILIADINRVSGELRKATPLRTEGWNAYMPSWTHDGRKLVFYSIVRDEPGFYIEDLQTQEMQALITGVESFSYAPALGTLTSDGKWLLFTRRQQSQQSAGELIELLRMPLDGGPAAHLLTGNFMLQCALRTPVCVLCDTKTAQPSFFYLDPVHGRGAL